MAGGFISVTQTVVFPAQPAVGQLFYVPLGGDGFVSPFAAYSLRSFQASGDASGTFISMNVNLDPRFVSLVAWVTVQIQQGTSADADFRIDVASDETGIISSGAIEAVASDVSGLEVSRTFSPHPTLLPGGSKNSRVVAAFDNVDGDEYFMDVWCYLFNIRVRETTPIAPLLWAAGGSA